MDSEQPTLFSTYLKDYPSLEKGLNRLKIINPTDFQEQILQVSTPLQNLIVTAPEGSGKRVSMLLLTLMRFANEQEGIMAYVAHSKQMSQELAHFLLSMTRIQTTNLFMQHSVPASSKSIIIGSPLQLVNLPKPIKDSITHVVLIECDYLMEYGYAQTMDLLAGGLNKQKVSWKISCVTYSNEIEKLKEKWIGKAVKIDYQPPKIESIVKTANIGNIQGEEQMTHFFQVGDSLIPPISLYVTLKFGLVNPKILILCDSLRQVYRYALFLQRCRIKAVGVYNHQNPINLKFYSLSLWMRGNIDILIATGKVIQDINSDIFRDNCKKAFKRNRIQLTNMTTIITINISHLQNQFQQMLGLFPSRPFLLTFLTLSQQQLQSLIVLTRKITALYPQSPAKKQLPITKTQLQAFRYRINDVFSVLNNHKVDLLLQLDLKKKMLKSADMKEYWAQNPKEREVIVKGINEIRKKLDHDKITISELVPDYLVPECLKTSYAERIALITKNSTEALPAHRQKVQRVLKYIDQEQEDPEVTDVSRLKLVSSRKRWKLEHGFKLKKRNLRNEKKGIFQTA